MSSMLKKKSGFKPKAPARRNAPASSSQASGQSATADRPSSIPTPPAPSTTSQDSNQVLALPSDAKTPSVDAQVHSPTPTTSSEVRSDVPPSSVTTAEATATALGPTRPGRSGQGNAAAQSVTPESETTQGKEVPARDPVHPPSDETASSSNISAPEHPPPTVALKHARPALYPTSQPTIPARPPAISVPEPSVPTSTAPTTPRAALPSVETPEKIDSRVITRQAATVAARLTAHNPTPSLTPGADRRSTPIASATQIAAIRIQPAQPATPPAESVDGHGSAVEVSGDNAAPPSSSQAPATKRGQKRTTNDGAAGQAKKRPRKKANKENDGETSKRAPRRRRQAETPEDAENEQGDADAQNQETASGDTEESRRYRQETPEDAENQKVDITKVKMAELARDLRIGKKFSLHDQLVRQEKEQRQQYTEARKKRFNSATPAVEDGQETQAENGTQEPNPEGVESGGTNEPQEDSAQNGGLTAPGPQFQIVDGQIVLDASSLQVDRHARAVEDAGMQEVVEENDFTRKVTSATYLRRKRKPQQWTDEETEEFYRLLRMIGTDFETISRMIPGKDRNNIIGKFRREDKMNPKRITEALTGPKTSIIKIEEYERLAGEKLESTEAIIAEQKAAEEEFEAEEKRREDEAAEDARKKREALYGKDGAEGRGGNEDDEAAAAKKFKKGRGKKSKFRAGGMGMH